MRWKAAFGICVGVLGATGLLWSQTPQVVAVRAGRMFDGKSAELLTNQVVLIQGERIRDVGPADRISIPAGAQIIDLGQATVLPGMIDGHTHIFDAGHGDVKPEPPPDVNLIDDTREYRTLVALVGAQKDLKAGFTTLRDLMNHGNGYADVDVRNAINRGLVMGPRMQVATMGLVATNGGITGSWELGVPTWGQVVDSPWAARQAVRDQIHFGADWIKLIATGGYHFEPDGHLVNDPTFTFEQVQAIVDEAHRQGKKVSCHAIAGEGVKNCVKAGVDTLEHGVDLDEPTLDMILQKGIYVVLTAYEYTALNLEKDLKDTGGKYSLAALREKSARMLISHGAKIAFGSGVGPFPHGSQAVEFGYMVRYGMTPAQAIQSATVVAAEMMGWQDRIGSIERGKYADIIAVAGDPLKDITELDRVKFVMKGGEVVRDDMK